MTPDLSCCVLAAPLSEGDAETLTVALKALADPVRIRLVSLLATAPAGEMCACDLPAALNKSQPTISHHLTQLVAAGLVDREQRGKWAWFRLNEAALATVRRALGEGAQAVTRSVSSLKPTVMFLCVHNAGRSQMAAGYMRSFAGESINVVSAGSTPAKSLNPIAVQAMGEEGIDITQQEPQRWTSDLLATVDVIVSMGCGDECPAPAGVRRLDWTLNDPAGQDIVFVRNVRDQIKEHVRALTDELTAGCCN